MPTNHVADVADFAGAIDQYEERAAELFNEAQESLHRDKQDKDAQGKLSAALSQLQSAEAMRSAQQERDGYAEVVKLMVTTATEAALLAAKLNTAAAALAPGTANFTQQADAVRALTGAVQALAQLSPAAVWRKPTEGA